MDPPDKGKKKGNSTLITKGRSGKKGESSGIQKKLKLASLSRVNKKAVQTIGPTHIPSTLPKREENKKN